MLIEHSFGADLQGEKEEDRWLLPLRAEPLGQWVGKVSGPRMEPEALVVVGWGAGPGVRVRLTAYPVEGDLP